MRKVLKQDFFQKDTVLVAKNLIGKYLVRKIDGWQTSAVIIETEAYDGPLDLACHGSRGKTKRNEVMFGEAGVFYVYFTYGMHWMLNVITGPVGYPAGVLIRGLDFVSGPGRITRELKVDKHFYGKKAEPKSGMWFENRGNEISPRFVAASPRIGVGYAGEWTQKLYRFNLVVK